MADTQNILGEYTDIFLEESEEQIEELNGNLLLLEKDHANPEIINDIFRAAHSLKSSAAFVGLYNLSDLAHKMENLLQKIREDKLQVNLDLVNLLFECFDLIRKVIVAVGDGKKIDTPFEDMIHKLDNYEKAHEGESAVSSKPEIKKEVKQETKQEVKQEPVAKKEEPPKQAEPIQEVVPDDFLKPISLDDEESTELEEELRIRNSVAYDIAVRLKKDTPMKGLRFALIQQNMKISGVVYKSEPEIEQLERGTDKNLMTCIFITQLEMEQVKKLISVDMIDIVVVKKRPMMLSAQNATKVSQNVVTQQVKKESNLDKELSSESKSASKTIRVSSEKLDQLMNNVGELVITNSGFQKIYDDLIRNFGEDVLFAELKSKIDQINRISKDLQSGIMNTRMVPIGTVFNRFSRLVRDLCLETGKKANLILLGENTELDKKVVDMIGEPLMHLIRNSIDHGVEGPEERLKAGKPEMGTIELNAYQGGNNIMVEIKDDGKGLSKARILKKAIDQGLISAQDANNLADNEVYQFIFAPGFSTAAQITDISGRGVGMNVVNKLIQDFKGKILINTSEGVGTSFTLCFPQALAIISSILVSMEEEIYAFPLSEVFETIRIKKDQINTLEGHEIINLRGEVLPIYRLHKIISLASRMDMEEFPVVIVNYNSRKLGFIVDELIGKHETVIKTLEKNYRNIIGLTGASIMGDGTIILVLDIPGLIELASNKLGSNESNDLAGKEMKRQNMNRATDINSSNIIFKTMNATNMYNSKLLDFKLVDKTRKKKDKANDRKRIVVEQPQREPVEESYKELESIESGLEERIEKHEKQIDAEQYNSNQPTSTNEHSISENGLHELTSNVEIFKPAKKKSENRDVPNEAGLTVSGVLKGFQEQRSSQIASITERNINELLTKEEIRKLESVVNTGMMNAGLVLSQLVGTNVELYMPEIMLADKDTLVRNVRDTEENMFGLKVRMNGDLNGNLLMIISEERGRELADKLLKSNENSDFAKKISDDSRSVLEEISNIVCSSVINSLSNKAKAQILPSPPELIVGNFREVLDLVKPEKTKFLSMNTEFIYDGGNLIGNLLFLPDFDELVKLIANLK